MRHNSRCGVPPHLDGKRRDAASTLLDCLAPVLQDEYNLVMSLTLQQLTEEALRLPAASRAQLADQLVESLAAVDAGGIQMLWAAEVMRRRDEVRSGAVKPIAGEQVIAEARRMVGR